MDNVKALTITLVSAIIFCHAVNQIESQITLIFKQTWGYEPTYYKKIQSFFVVVVMLGLALVTLVFYMAELDNGQVQQIFRSQLTYSLFVAIGILITMLTKEVFKFTIFGQFVCHVWLASSTLDEQNFRALCIYMEPFDCLMPTGTITISDTPPFYPTVNSSICPLGDNPADKVLTHVTMIEFWLIVGNFVCCLLLISLIRTLINFSTLFEQYSLKPAFFNKLKPIGLKQLLLSITCLSYLIAAIVFCISFYRGSASFYSIIKHWHRIQPGWMVLVQILYCSYAIFSGLTVFMFLIPQTIIENSVFSALLKVSTYAFMFVWLAIELSIGVPTYITLVYTCYCKFLIANENNLPNPACLSFQNFAWSLFQYEYLHFFNCDIHSVIICKFFLEAKPMLILAYLSSSLFVPALILFLMFVKKSADPDIINEISRKSPAHSLSTSNSSDSE